MARPPNTIQPSSGPGRHFSMQPRRGRARAHSQRQISLRAPGNSNILCLTEEELDLIERDLEFSETLQIGSPSEIAVLSALTKRYCAIDTKGCLAVFDMIDTDRNGYLTVKELEKGVESRAVREYIEKTRNVTLKGLLKVQCDREKFEKVFTKLDKTKSGVIIKDDFVKFVRDIAKERIRHMRATGLLYGRCYWGFGLDADPNAPRCCKRHVPLGFCADWQYYVRNNHPFLALYLRDEDHPYSKGDAFCTELIRHSYCLCVAILIDDLERDWTTLSGAFYNWQLSIVCITVPVMALERLLFYVLACPCLRFERRGREREKYLACLECGCECLGHVVVWPLALVAIAFIVYAIYNFYLHPAAHAHFALLWIAGLLSEYLLTWPLLKLCVQFNLCYPVCERCCCFGCFFGCCGLWDFFGCGRWANERHRATELAINDAGDDEYFEFLTTARTTGQTDPCCCAV